MVSGLVVELTLVGQVEGVDIQVGWRRVVRVISSLVYDRVGMTRCVVRSAT